MTHRTCDNEFFPRCVWIDSWVVFNEKHRSRHHASVVAEQEPTNAGEKGQSNQGPIQASPFGLQVRYMVYICIGHFSKLNF